MKASSILPLLVVLGLFSRPDAEMKSVSGRGFQRIFVRRVQEPAEAWRRGGDVYATLEMTADRRGVSG